MFIDKLFVIAQVTTTVVLYVLIALSVLSVGAIGERWLYFFRRRVRFADLAADVTPMLRAGDARAAQERLAESKGLEAEIVRDALDWYDDGPAAFAQIVDKNIRQKRKEYEGGLLFLGTLGNNAPFIGLFGTVLGIVTAFRGLASTTSAGAMGNVMAAIAEALIATAIGILVAIPAVVAYNVFEKKGSQVEENAQSLAAIAIATLESTASGPARNENGARHEARVVVGG